ncbi:hypothetical protein OUZ56_001558 [Daphnia magna]|uniref:Uncharacterized protein n=1 Tax=Daphnia magna TaxID=35525 RepID=A0ABR0A320_9CRUS|nr:hypothetical protein OUZ56_001558 [Daphnia magna]
MRKYYELYNLYKLTAATTPSRGSWETFTSRPSSRLPLAVDSNGRRPSFLADNGQRSLNEALGAKAASCHYKMRVRNSLFMDDDNSE